MKLSTTAFAKFESIGKPKMTQQLDNMTMREIVLAFGKWTQEIYMGSHIRVTIARSAEELESITTGKRNAGEVELISELESLLDQELLDLCVDDEPTLLEKL
jgi:hypothetical protein